MNLIIFLLFSFDYSIKSRIDFVYDYNIFEYSEKYLQEFIQQVNPERFPFETYDDLYTYYRLHLQFRNKFWRNHNTTFNLSFSGYNYFINEQKDYSIFTAGLRQSFGRWAVKIEHLYLPRYLIRYYKDPENSRYIGCEFSERLCSFKLSFIPDKEADLSLVIGYEIDDYIKEFDVYDSRALRVGPVFEFGITKFFKPEIHYEFKSSRAKGPIPDISYNQHKLFIKTELYTGFPKFSKWEFAYQMRYRIYTTEVSPVLDSPHSGRLDTVNNFKISWEFPILAGLYFTLGYSCEFRHSHSEVYPDIGEYKNYNKWTADCGLEFVYF
ncbi:MAG: hypothetical protein ABIL70_08980 [candidate division WOR-3 bacterium]